MDVWPIELTNVRAALDQDPGLRVYRSRPSPIGRLMGWAQSRFMRGRLPPRFRGTMGEPDTRLPRMEIGLGVITEDAQRFYPVKRIGVGIEDSWTEGALRVSIHPDSQVPYAVWQDGARPMQLFTRWYGFSYTYPQCEIYGQSGA
jgi:hypothetical protein